MIIKTAGIFLINKNMELMVAHPTNHAKDFWSITKGKQEDDEDSLTCALRETYEECNVDLRGMPINYYKLEKVTFKNKRKRLTPYVIFEEENDIDFSKFEFKCNSNVEPEKGGFPEMDRWRWVNILEAKQYVHESQVICIDTILEMLEYIEFRKPL